MLKNLFSKTLLCAALLSSVDAMAAASVKVYPMNLKNVGVGVPKTIYVENVSDEPTFITALSGQDNIIVYPPVIETLAPGQKEPISVAFIAPSADEDKQYVLVKIGEGSSFRIGVQGQ